ncbi:ABC transporter permease subunit [Nocardioides sp. Y6]|uniref:ABC transporter permease subunit n=1 Tax=Nocardioides malaquae TaxID=2773426 RepID=A0ABR9RU14_9ACTN|nr:ABC transporter permease subunit [Nocardioides malaquae]MBE7325059.1 ABC transporter permease subunit [Nocardioides malaquae]
MSTTTTLAGASRQSYAPAPADAHPPAPGISFAQLCRVELVKMFNTRSGFWLAASIVILSVLATAGVLVFAPDSAITYGSFATAIGMPMAIILPVIAILAVTSEYSQRTGLTTYTLVPSRSRVVAAKAVVTIGIGVVGMLVATAIGALGNLLGATVRDVDAVWRFSAYDLGLTVLANVIGVAMGFTLGVLLRNSPAAIVAYFVYSFVFPNVMGALAFYRESFHDVWPWVDLFYNQTFLYDNRPDAEGWAQLGVTAVIWLVLPLAFGLRRLMRAEVK